MKFFRILAAALLVSASFGAKAGVVWQLNNFVFNDETTATGNFEWDADSNKAIAWNIVTKDGAKAGVTYNNTTGSAFNISSLQVILFTEGVSQFRLGLSSLDALDTPSASLIPFSHNPGFIGNYGYAECENCSPYRLGWEGAYLSAVVNQPADVPEPGSIALIGLALGALGAVRLRKA